MAAFSKKSFAFAAYASLRPTYPQYLYDTILAYHKGSREVCVDLGCGHGIVARAFSPFFTKIIGTDPSPGMLEQAQSLAVSGGLNVEYRQASAESLPFVNDEGVDLVVSGQAAHWFDYPRFFPEMRRILKRGGTLALWGYKDPVFIGRPRATNILNHYAYGTEEHLLGAFWSQPGRSIVQNKLRDIKPPAEDWEDVRRIDYEPEARGKHFGEGTLFLEKSMKLRDCMNYIRTWSSYHGWQQRFPDQKKREDGGNGDIVDEMFDEIRETESDWQDDVRWTDREVGMEWGSGLIMAKRK